MQNNDISTPPNDNESEPQTTAQKQDGKLERNRLSQVPNTLTPSLNQSFTQIKESIEKKRYSNMPILSLTQRLLQSACKRKRLSSTGTKKQLAHRLGIVNIKSAVDAFDLAQDFEKHGVDNTTAQLSKPKSPNWTANEAARLCHTIADPRHATAIGKLYNKMDNRAQIDQGKADPWTLEFVELFNDIMYKPCIPEATDGVTNELILNFDPTKHPHVRTGSFLKSRWNKMRSTYTVAIQKFTKSGQGEHDVFENFTDGDDGISYMHCEFKGLPALEAIVRALPDGSRVEVGLAEGQVSGELFKGEAVSKATKSKIWEDGLSKLADAVSAPLQVNIMDAKHGESSTRGEPSYYDKNERIASTVNKLMALETAIMENIRKASVKDETNYVIELCKRLSNIQKRIDQTLND